MCCGMYTKKDTRFSIKRFGEMDQQHTGKFRFQSRSHLCAGQHRTLLPAGGEIQIFHGYAAEKKDHWVIRRYFDIYCTQGPYFTSHFKALAKNMATSLW